jgi:alginate O-acetyltransferase complex protein AlgJ
MKAATHYDSREEQAKAEVGVTAISRPLAIAATALFLVTIATVLLIDQSAGGWRVWRSLGGDAPLHDRLHAFETDLKTRSETGTMVRNHIEPLLHCAGVSGAENIYLGRDGWLFYEPDVRYVLAGDFSEHKASAIERGGATRAADPIAAILEFKKQLAARGIALVIVPTPVKPTMRPEMLLRDAQAPLQNAAFDRFKDNLEKHGVPVFDIASRVSSDANLRQYLATDTHWRPEAMEAAASLLARFVNARVTLPQSLGMEYKRTQAKVQGRGDLAALLSSSRPAERETVTIHPVLLADGQRWSPREKADILWLGDSFSNIYSAEAMGWGGAAGFAEQFSFALGRTCDSLRRNDNGAYATRQMLADDLAAGHDRFKGKKLVIWQFATRELTQGDWKLIELNLAAPQPRRMIVPPAGETWNISGVVAEKGAAPPPGTVAYRDHVMAILVSGVKVDNHAVPGGQAIVYLRSMIDGKLTPAAALQIGAPVRIKIRDWSEVARQYEFIHRSDLSSNNWRGQPACWGELLP